MLDYEQKYYSSTINFIVGCDEAGRGPLAGPVVAAAVIMPRDFHNEEINDSKQLSDTKRRQLYDIIIKNALAYAIVEISSDEIDEINIYQASRKAMEIAIGKLRHPIDMILTDAMPLRNQNVKVEAIIRGDELAMNIACASILAKVTRDDLMINLDGIYPQYGFKNNKGYATREHLEALEEHGPLLHIHRFTYEPVRKLKTKQLSIF